MSKSRKSIGYGAYGDHNFGTVMPPWGWGGSIPSPKYSSQNVCDQRATFEKHIATRQKQLERIKVGKEIWVQTSYSDPIGREVSAPPKPKPESKPTTVAGLGSTDVTAAINAISSGILNHGYGTNKYQLTAVKANSEIKIWQGRLASAQRSCDRIISEHGSIENQKRYNHQVGQRNAALYATARNMAAERCKDADAVSTIASTDYFSIRKATHKKARDSGLFPTSPARLDAKATPEQRTTYYRVANAYSAKTREIIDTLDADPAIKAAKKKMDAAQLAARRCREDEQARAKRELDYKMPVPKRGDSPCGPMPTPKQQAYGYQSKDRRKIAISTHGIAGLGDFGRSMAIQKQLVPMKTNNLTCCPSDNKWHTHPHGTFFTCPGDEVKQATPKRGKKILGIPSTHFIIGVVCMGIFLAVATG